MLIHYLLYEDRSKNLTISFFLDFYTFFKVYYSWIQLNPCHLAFYCLNYWSFLWAFSIILIKLAFWSTQIVTKIGTQRYQWTSISFFYVIFYIFIIPTTFLLSALLMAISFFLIIIQCFLFNLVGYWMGLFRDGRFSRFDNLF